MNKLKLIIIAVLCSILIIALNSCKGDVSKSSLESSSTNSVKSSESIESSKSKSSISSSKIEKTDFDLTFNALGGGVNTVETYTRGNTVIAPTNLSKEGWSFGGWYTNRFFTDKFSFTMPSEDTEIFAKWTKVENVITSFKNADVSPVATAPGEVLELPSNPIKDGYDFNGWYTNIDLSNPYSMTNVVTADQTLYAKWNQKESNLYVTIESINETLNKSIEVFYLKDESLNLNDDLFGQENSYTLYMDKEMSMVYDGNKIANNTTLYADIETKGLSFVDYKIVSYSADLMNPAETVLIPFKHNGVSITEIADDAFYNIDSMMSVIMTNQITVIGKRAFAFSSYLVEAKLPENLISLGEHAFDSAVRLVNIGSLGKLTNVPAFAFMGDLALENFVVPDSLTSISEYAFSNDKSLTSFDFKNVTSIASYAFSNSNLETVNLPESLVSLGNGSFMNVSANFSVDDKNSHFILSSGLLTSLNEKTLYMVSKEVAEFRVDDYDEIKIDALSNAKFGKVIIENSEFSKGLLIGVESINYLVVPNLDTDIAVYFGGSNAKSNGLGGQYIPSDITTVEVTKLTKDIPAYAFYGMNNLVDIKNVELEVIGDFAFAGTAIKTLELDKDLTEFNPNIVSFVSIDSISANGNTSYKVLSDGSLVNISGNELIYVPSSLVEYSIPNSINIIKENAFIFSLVENIVVPITIDKLESGAFANMRSLKTYTAPFIGDGVSDQTMYSPFGGKISANGEITGNKVPSTIGVVTITENIKNVAANAFLLCDGLLEINLPDSVKSIGDYALALTGISSIILPENCENLGGNAFSMNFNLTRVQTNAKLRTLGTTVFARNPFIEEVVFAEGLENIPAKTFDIYTENKISGDESSPLLYLSKINKIVLPSTLKTIGSEAFSYAGLWLDDLETSFELTIRDLENSQLVSIGDGAFKNSSLSYAILPNTLEEIGNNAFDGATNLYEVEIGSNLNSSLRRIGDGAFKNTDLRKLTISKTVSGNDTAISVGSEAFTNCRRLVIYVPSNFVSVYKADEKFSDLNVVAEKE